ncbi:MFS transporter small subunit [Alloacidobacterium dinghuense]
MEKKSSPTLIALAWLLVCIPAAWGVYNTVLSAMKLFR